MQPETTPSTAILPIPARRGRIRLSDRFAAPRREGTYCLPLRLGDELKVALRSSHNRDAGWRVAVFLFMAQGRPDRFGAPFPIDRRALNCLLCLRLTENQLRGSIATLLKAGILIPAGGGGFDRDRQRNRPVLYLFHPHFAGFLAARIERRKRRLAKSPTPGLWPKESQGLGGFRTPTLPPPTQPARKPDPQDSDSGLEAALGRLASAVLSRQRP